MPLLTLAILYALAVLISPAFAPTFSLLGFAALLAGFFEEVGWTGFAVPRLRPNHRWLWVGLSVGALWGLWHGLADYAIRGNALGSFWPITFALFVLPLIAWAAHWFRTNVRESYRQVRGLVARLNAFLQEHLTGIATVQAFNQEPRTADAVRGSSHLWRLFRCEWRSPPRSCSR